MIATKFAPTPWRHSREDVVAACKASCERLGVDCVDLFQLHHPDIVQPLRRFGLTWSQDPEMWEGLADCVDLGLARNVGVCNYGPTLLDRAQEALARRNVHLATNQINFSLLFQRQGVMPTIDACKQRGIGVMAYWPLAMGLLSGSDQLSAPGRRGEDLQAYLHGGGCVMPTGESVPAGGVSPFLKVLRRVAMRYDKTCSQVALNWLICQGVVPIPGASTATRLQEYLGALGWRLAPGDVEELRAAGKALPFDFEGAGFRISTGKFVGYGIEHWHLD